MFKEYANDVTYSQQNGIKIKIWPGTYNYHGMVNKDNKPHGWGRAIHTDNYCFIDGQWKDGEWHGYLRCIT